ncbi:hypothetical protein F909_02774 [Acinetobacter sp. ANC 3929]|uniref:DUF5677 domain-containing protein n=1 Tax=unclassified Acinetobacter TaxID=196816 RepID=UPI0002CF397F|nr:MULTISPECIES: DUF5677 domain-containing protein [unclassified Acinetobacter]ENW81483.1 hypothetical protein F909_02774 [Acinetobacter sp. ANC 3929]MCH7351964.1 DUF5677 domain-containing protein [Acinetobacter sp. NIPH 2023]MCH7354520.1 DUF5677 domain-containing protein [Acinetobacter sp. NIPH 1958]MCH7359642.1 DUF5677 domain-containing protein [Acinetobacter sp. NIPH 2024]
MNANDFENACISLDITNDDLPKDLNLENVKTMIYKKRIDKQLEISHRLLNLAIEISACSKGDMLIDCAYLCKITLLRLINHFKTCLDLAKNSNSDVNLISRSIFEGGLYFFYLSHDPKKIREWRLYSCVETLKFITLAETNEEDIPHELFEQIKPYQEEMDKTFKKQDGKYYSSWKKGMSIKDMASKTPKFGKLYHDYYIPLSDYHHWGVSSLAYHYQITEDKLDIQPVQSSASLEMISKSIDLANSSIYSLLEASISIFHLVQFNNELEQIMKDFLKIPFARKLG